MAETSTPDRWAPFARAVIMAGALTGLLVGTAEAATETAIWDFTGLGGSTPESNLVADAAGNLYGTTSAGGASTDGAVFRLNPPAAGQTHWTETILYSFCALTNCSDGTIPSAGLTSDGSGGFFGVTPAGGSANGGTAFHLQPPAKGQTAWVYSVLHNFCTQQSQVQTCLDSGAPTGNLVRSSAGILYGTAFNGGAYGWGAIFSLAPPTAGHTTWTYTILHNFSYGDGANPEAGLTMAPSGALYGSTLAGGAYGKGAVFELTPPTAPGKSFGFAVLHDFCADPECTDGGGPNAGLLLVGTTLFGTAELGGAYGYGSVYRLTSPPAVGKVWGYGIIQDFHIFDGSTPLGGLVADSTGRLYGTTSTAGERGFGTAFMLAPPSHAGGAWALTTLHNFAGYGDGQAPQGTLLRTASGQLFGTTLEGGGAPNDGQVFEIIP